MSDTEPYPFPSALLYRAARDTLDAQMVVAADESAPPEARQTARRIAELARLLMERTERHLAAFELTSEQPHP